MMHFSSRHSLGLLLLALAFASCACAKKVATAPPVAAPPPPASPPAPAAPGITLNADRTTITAGQSITLAWQATNATAVNIQPDLGTVPLNGTRQVSPGASVQYSATATGRGGTAGATLRVTVNPAPRPTPVTAPPPPAPRPAPLSLDQQFAQAIQTILFDYDRSDIRADQVGMLLSNAAWLKQNATVRFTVEGHADERGGQEYNIALGDDRADAVKKYLASQGIAENRMNAVSYGEERPDCRDQNEECYQRNRRAGFTRIP